MSGYHDGSRDSPNSSEQTITKANEKALGEQVVRLVEEERAMQLAPEIILAKLDRIIELLEVQVGALITAQEEADQPEEVDRGYIDG